MGFLSQEAVNRHPCVRCTLRRNDVIGPSYCLDMTNYGTYCKYEDKPHET